MKMNTINFYTKKYEHMPSKIEIANLGTSQASFAFDYTGISENAFNFALCINTFEYDMCLLKEYKDRLVKGTVVIITVLYPIFYTSDKKILQKHVKRQYARLLSYENSGLPLKEWIAYRYVPSFFIKKDVYADIKGLEDRNGRINHYRTYELDAICTDILRGWERELGLSSEIVELGKIPDSYSTQEDITLKKICGIAEFCKNMGWRPVIATLPYSAVLNQRISDKFLERCFYAPLSQLERTCPVYDYSHYAALSDKRYYLHVNYLNRTGREKFTRKVIEDLRQDGLIGGR